MKLEPRKIGAFLRERRVRLAMTQAELSERIGVSAQSVSNWERGETLPDIALLPDLARILDCSIEAMLGGGQSGGGCRRRVTVADMREATACMERLRALLGADHFMVRTMIDALNQRMNSTLESAFSNDAHRDAYICEMLLACMRSGDYVDRNDVQAHIAAEGPRQATLKAMEEMGLQ